MSGTNERQEHIFEACPWTVEAGYLNDSRTHRGSWGDLGDVDVDGSAGHWKVVLTSLLYEDETAHANSDPLESAAGTSQQGGENRKLSARSFRF